MVILPILCLLKVDAFTYAQQDTSTQFELLGDDAASPSNFFDMVWVDLGAGPRIGRFIAGVWPSVNPQGGLLLLHSSLTNEVTRKWLEAMRRLSRRRMSGLSDDTSRSSSGGGGRSVSSGVPSAPDNGASKIGEARTDAEKVDEDLNSDIPGLFVEVSFLEPHKLFQNSFTVFQRCDEGFSEPTYTTYG